MFVGEAINFSCRYIFGDILTDRILKAKQISDDIFKILDNFENQVPLEKA